MHNNPLDKYGEEKILNFVINNIHDVLFVIDDGGIILFCSPSIHDFTGRNNYDVSGRPLGDFINREDVGLLENILADGLQKKINGVKLRLVDNGGESTNCLLSGIPIRDEDGFTGMIGVLMHDRQEDILKVEDEKRLLSRAIEQSPASVVMTDVEGRIIYVNPKFTEVTGYGADEVLGKNPRILKSGIQTTEFYRVLWETILSGKEWRGEFHNRKKNGELYWEFASISPYRNRDGEITHFLAVKEDITKRKYAEDAIRERNSAMEREMRYAKEIIKKMLPSAAPKMKGITIEYRYTPLEEIGGDFFSFNTFPDGSLGFFLGDVAGHGVSAALFLSLVKSNAEKYSALFGAEPLNYIESLNEELFSSMLSYFMTALYGRFYRDSEGMKFTFAKGGHPPPLVYRAKTAKTEIVSSRGKPLGMFDSTYSEEVTLLLDRGDKIYFYTDGITETANEQGNMLEIEGLSDIITAGSSGDVAKCLDDILEKVKLYRGGLSIEDDIVLIGVEINENL